MMLSDDKTLDLTDYENVISASKDLNGRGISLEIWSVTSSWRVEERKFGILSVSNDSTLNTRFLTLKLVSETGFQLWLPQTILPRSWK